jgi:ferrous iron transport protein B
MKIALAGNPNCGKTTLFNNLTGMKQHVGNWPGKTVEKKEGLFKHKGKKIDVIDLPGTYSLTAYSIEEIVARDYIVEEKPDVVINIIDASNIERNLYLTVQLIELGANVILALNMNKYANKKGLKIDSEKLSQLLGIPVVMIEAIDETGKKALIDSIIQFNQKKSTNKLKYGNEIEEHLEQMTEMIKSEIDVRKPDWIALKLLEKDKQIIDKVSKLKNGKKVLFKAKQMQNHLDEIFGEDVDAAIADARYGFIAGLLKESVRKPSIDKMTRSENIDKVVTSKIFGIPLFLLAMYLLFQITFTVSAPIVDWIDRSIGSLAELSMGFLGSIGAPAWFISLVGDGIFGGVGSVLVFVPIIMIMFLIISLMEDSGYMARAAFIMDKVMHKIGLHGKAFIPFLLGFGCTVPSIMATRTLESKKDRIMTMLLSPMMSCGARLPVYVLFTAAFFVKNEAEIIFSIYVLGIIMAVIMGLIFKKFLFKGTSSPFVMELPPYRLPTLKGSLIHMWERGKLFMIKAGTVIFGAVLVIWFLSSIPFGVEYGSEASAVGMIGKVVAPVFEPLGFGNWQTSVSLFFGIIAKEVIVGSFGTLYGVGEEGLIPVLQEIFTPLSAYAFLALILIYTPCLVVLATIKRETNSWKWPAFTAVYLFALGWIVAFIIYQGGLLLGLG